MSSLLVNINNITNTNNITNLNTLSNTITTTSTTKHKLKIVIDTVCFQLPNNKDICFIWEQFLNNLPNNKNNFKYEIILLQRIKQNGNPIYQFNPSLQLEKKFKIISISEFNYMTMNQDVDMLNNICNINNVPKYDVFISSAFTYCNIIPNIVIVYDMIPEINKEIKNHILIQKNKAILNASSFITFSKKTYDKLLEFYPHISKNNYSIDIIKHNIADINPINNTNLHLERHTLHTYLSTLENTTNSNSILKKLPFINIILQSYPETNQDRLKELKYCLIQNLKNPYVKMVYDFGSGIELFESNDNSDNSDSSNTNLKDKYTKIENTKWLTFDIAIKFANLQNDIECGNYWCIINLDIFLDDNSKWNTIKGQINNGFIYAQSRHEFNIIEGNTNTNDNTNTNTNNNTPNILAKMDPNFAQLYHANTQDAWLFKTPCNITSTIDFDFELGFLGCDNAIAERFTKAGYKVINQPITYKIFHYDIAKGKTSTNYLEKHIKETKEMTDKMIKPKNKYPERVGSYLVPNYDQMISMTGRQEIDLIQLINSLGGCSNWERYEFISRLFSDRIIINNP